mmetsp:Transcript_50047/g.73508  ORF Transcript_50047/g.73508 Transcript_50047/m.73508 type:complete len:421 (+) Transcript_50047:739-2001(+)
MLFPQKRKKFRTSSAAYLVASGVADLIPTLHMKHCRANFVGQKKNANVIGVHFIGHGDSEGLFLGSGTGNQMAPVDMCSLKLMLESAPFIEVCLLNACDTEKHGRLFLVGGVKHVVCWRGKVADSVAMEFSKFFYTTLYETPGDYVAAFKQGMVRCSQWQFTQYYQGYRRPAGRPFFLSRDGSVIEDLSADDSSGVYTARLSDNHANEEHGKAAVAAQPADDEIEMPEEASVVEASDDGHSTADYERSMDNAKGHAELAAFKVLGFFLDYKGFSIEAGIRLHKQRDLKVQTAAQLGQYGLEIQKKYNNLCLSSLAAAHVFGLGVQRYTDKLLWNKNGIILRKAKTLELWKVEKAIEHFQVSLDKRTRGGNSGHNHMRVLIQNCVAELKSLVSTRQREIPAVPLDQDTVAMSMAKLSLSRT